MTKKKGLQAYEKLILNLNFAGLWNCAVNKSSGTSSLVSEGGAMSAIFQKIFLKTMGVFMSFCTLWWNVDFNEVPIRSWEI